MPAAMVRLILDSLEPIKCLLYLEHNGRNTSSIMDMLEGSL